MSKANKKVLSNKESLAKWEEWSLAQKELTKWEESPTREVFTHFHAALLSILIKDLDKAEVDYCINSIKDSDEDLIYSPFWSRSLAAMALSETSYGPTSFSTLCIWVGEGTWDEYEKQGCNDTKEGEEYEHKRRLH